jgi:hypothetical protein
MTRAQELSPSEKALSADLQRCPAQNADKCHTAALQQFDAGLRKEFPTPGAAYWGKALAALKRHGVQLGAGIRSAEKQAAASGNAASNQSLMAACRNAGGTFAECYYWVMVLRGGR